MNFKAEPGKIYDTIFFFIEYFNRHEIDNNYIKAFDNSELMLECYQYVEKKARAVPKLLRPLFYIEGKRVSPISVFFSNHFDFENDDIDTFILKLTTNSDVIYQNTADCVFDLYEKCSNKKIMPMLAPGNYIEAINDIDLPSDFKLQLSLLFGNFSYAMSLLAAWMKKVYCIIDELHSERKREISLEWEQIQSASNTELYVNKLAYEPKAPACVSISLLQQYLLFINENSAHTTMLLGLKHETAILDNYDESKATAENFILTCSNEIRWKIIKALVANKEMTASQIARYLDIPVTTMIRHLSHMHENGIIYVSNREKLQIYYKLNDKLIRKIKIDLDAILDLIIYSRKDEKNNDERNYRK